jgi:hypothetical protein
MLWSRQPPALAPRDHQQAAPGHHVGQQEVLFVRHRKSRLQPRQIRGLDNRGLVGEHV